MEDDGFKRLVNKLPIRGTIIEIYYGMTPSKKRYAIIINQVWWFAIRLVFEGDLPKAMMRYHQFHQLALHRRI